MQPIFDMKICVIYNRPRQLIAGGNHKRGSMGHNVTNLLVHCSWRLTNHIPVSTNPPSQPQHIARPLHHHIPALLPRSFHPLQSHAAIITTHPNYKLHVKPSP
jgi:hypothetical protein